MQGGKRLEISLVNRPGVLGELVSALWEEGVSLKRFRAKVSNGRTRISLIVDKPTAARRILAYKGWNRNLRHS